MSTRRMKTYVVNLKRRADRRARMERVLPATWDAQFTSDWDGPMDGQAIDLDDLRGFGHADFDAGPVTIMQPDAGSRPSRLSSGFTGLNDFREIAPTEIQICSDDGGLVTVGRIQQINGPLG